MLTQAIHWFQIGSTVVETLLLFRILTLKLHRTYAFITLYWAVNVIFDIATSVFGWQFGWEGPESRQLSVYQVPLFAVLFPLAAWDAFEEVRPQILKLRRLHATRLMSGLFITAILACICSFGLQDQDSQGISTFASIGLFLWLGSASASLLFVWNLLRTVKSQGVIVPRNTSVWSIYFIIAFGLAITNVAVAIAGQTLGAVAVDVLDAILLPFDIGLAIWCFFKLKAVPSDVTSEPEKARL